MSMSVSASSNALSYLQQLLQYGTSGPGATSSDPLLALDPTITGSESSSQQSNSSPIWSGSSSSFEPGTLAALISLQGQTASGVVGQSPSDLFSQLDTDGDGQISKTEFEQALGAVGVDTQSADALFGKLDANSDGNVGVGELNKAHGRGHHHHQHAESTGPTQGGDPQQGGLSSLLNSSDITGATTQTATNPDGSTTTTISYADGTSVSTTTSATSPNNVSSNNDPNSGSGGPSSSSNDNLIEQLIKLQSQLVTQAASALSTIA
jgi:hypothetical protein